MRNEKGISLVEVLASITITTIILSVVIMLFSSINLESSSSTNRYTYNANVNFTTDVLSRNLSSCNAIYKFTTSGQVSEWRIKTSENSSGLGTFGYKALVYDVQTFNGSSIGVLTLYDISLAQYSSNAAINYTISTNYTKKTILANNLSAAILPTFKQSDGVTELPTAPSLSNGELIIVTIPFQFTRAKSSGSPIVEDKPKSMTYKLINDNI